MMTRNQINIAVGALLNQAEIHINAAKESTDPAEQSAWIVHMAASMVCSDLIATLLALRETLTEDPHHAASKENIG